MKRITEKLWFSQLVGVIFVFIVGTIWHNLYGYMDENPIIGLVAPVNESSWEHWKIAFFPWLLMMFLEYPLIKNQVTNFLFSKIVGLIAFQLFTFGVLYVYGQITGTHSLVLDIVIYFIGIVIGQIVSYYLMTSTNEKPLLSTVALVLIVIELIFIFIYTINPPRSDYFKDSRTGTYGIYKYTD